MRKLWIILSLALVLGSSTAEARRNKDPLILENRAYIFYLESCPMCREARQYIKGKYQNRADILWQDLETEKGRSYLRSCARKFNISSIGIPMFCIGNQNFMGWSGAAAQKFDKALYELSVH